MTKILQEEVVVNEDMDKAEERLLSLPGIRKFLASLKTDKEKDDFKKHARRYLSIYLPDCPFEVSSTNRYTIVTQEASVTARRPIRKNETIKYLEGIQVLITPKEEEEMTSRKKDFSIVVSSRSRCASLFMGPARFANHDCRANARLKTTGHAGMEVVATRAIDTAEEITVTYGDNYFGEGNCECLCQTCEDGRVNGWAGTGEPPVQSIEGDAPGYSLRRRRRDDSVGASSRTSSLTPDIRPRILKRSRSQRFDATASPSGDALGKRVLGFATPPFTPSKRQKVMDAESVVPIPLTLAPSDESTESELSSSGLSPPSGDSPPTEATSVADSPASGPEDEAKPVGEVCEQEQVRNAVGPAVTILNKTTTEAPAPPDLSEDEVKPTEVCKQELPNGPETTVPNNPATQRPVTPIVSQDEVRPTGELVEQVQPSNEAGHDAAVTNQMAIDNKGPETVPEAISEVSPLTPVAPNATPVERPETPVTAAPGVADITPAATPNDIRLTTEPTEATAPQPTPTKRPYRKRRFQKEPTPPPARRTPGDYTLTPLLLSEPNTAWIHCTICTEAFVQRDAYYTRSACPRCERHSKLYGYVWPKTARSGSGDREERVLDHRTVHRFLDCETEAKIRGRKVVAPVGKGLEGGRRGSQRV